MKRKLSMLLVLSLTVGLIMGCGNSSEETAANDSDAVETDDTTTEENTTSEDAVIPDGEITIKIGTSASDTSAITQGANWFAEQMHERTGGLVSVKVYSNDQISGGAQADGIQMLMEGTADMTFHSNLIYSTLDQRLNVISLPWMFDGYEDVDTTLAGEAGDAIKDILADYGITVLGFAQNGFRQLTNSVRPVSSAKDLDGLQIRVNNSQMQLNLFQLMGADPLNMNFPEVFTALQQGAIDGQETPIDVTYSSNLHEVQDYLTVWNYMYDSFILGINTEIFNSYSPELQKILVETAAEACEWQRQFIRDTEETELEEIIASGVEVTNYEDINLEDFKNAAEPIYDEYEEIVTPELLSLFRD